MAKRLFFRYFTAFLYPKITPFLLRPIVELCEWLDMNEGKVSNIFKGVSVTTVKSPIGNTNSYTDIMLYKLNAV